ncbi:MAG: hypothetical protein H7175_27415, partial [Burkholderiales bacterium]|nr:hypothetical protein [Anaerolineae bacterium]
MRVSVPRFVQLLLLLCCLLLIAPAGAQEGYVIPPDPEGVDVSLAIAAVRDQPITLGAFRARVRYERWRYFETLLHLVRENGISALDPNDLENPQAGAVQNVATLLSDQATFGLLVYEAMIRESIYHNELQARMLEVDPCAVNRGWSVTLSLPIPTDCQVAPEFEAARADYIQRATIFSGMSDAEIEQTIISRVEVETVQAAIAVEATPPPVPTATTRHIRLATMG